MSLHADFSQHPHFGGGGERAERYFASMYASIEVIARRTTNPQKTRKRLLTKLNTVESIPSDFRQYLQHACETSVVAYFARIFDCEFFYEPRIQGQGAKNVDARLTCREFTFNVEVKCPDPKPRSVGNELARALSIRTHGRVDFLDDFMQDMDKLALGLGRVSATAISNSDHKIKDCLLDSAKKFGSASGPQQLNCVVISCASPDDVQHYYHCLFGAKGLFTTESFHPPHEYDSVESVVLTNVLNRHELYYIAKSVDDPWEFEHAFNIVLGNPRCRNKKEVELSRFASLIPNFNHQITEYVVPGGNPLSVNDPIKLLFFIRDELPKFGPSLFYSASAV